MQELVVLGTSYAISVILQCEKDADITASLAVSLREDKKLPLQYVAYYDMGLLQCFNEIYFCTYVHAESTA